MFPDYQLAPKATLFVFMLFFLGRAWNYIDKIYDADASNTVVDAYGLRLLITICLCCFLFGLWFAAG